MNPKRRPGRQPLNGGYFIYCQWCKWDGRCTLRHHQFLGARSSGKVDDTPYVGHENQTWSHSGFQRGSRAMCRGKIYKTDSVFFPLQCECGTVISSLNFSSIFGLFCAKFQPNERGKERLAIAQKIAQERGVDPSQIGPEDLPEADPDYKAAMMY